MNCTAVIVGKDNVRIAALVLAGKRIIWKIFTPRKMFTIIGAAGIF